MSDTDSANLITREIATGVLALFEETGELTLKLPYPSALQRGFERLTWFSQQRESRPPQSIAELLRWCALPFKMWPTFTNIAYDGWAGGDPLLMSGLPTDYCEELHCPNINVADELEQNEFFAAMLDECRGRQDQHSYVAFRQFLIETPIIEAGELQMKLAYFPSATMKRLLRDVYEPIPITHSIKNQIHICASCGYVRHPLPNRKTVCENDVCRIHHSGISATVIPYTTSLLRLRRPFRRYITYPGLAEVQLANRLKKANVVVQLWPHFDRYDIHITTPNGAEWAIDVKDWANPFLLGEAIKKETFTPSSAYSRFLFVIPKHRLANQTDYVRAVKSRCPNIKGHVDILSESQFIRQLNKHITGR